MSETEYVIISAFGGCECINISVLFKSETVKYYPSILGSDKNM